jgi:hypothetical protein
MDPYLEQRWGDVHTRLCTYISGVLQADLPDGLRARAQEDVLVEDFESFNLSSYEPDITIIETERAEEIENRNAVVLAVSPVVVRHIQRPRPRRWIEILDTSDSNRVVTAIKILSPGNKASGKLNQSYREKLEPFIDGNTNVVEIDLLRSSRKRLAVPSHEIPEERRADYYVSICKATAPATWLVYPMPLRQPLPAVPIPCRETDPDVPLALQPIIDKIYLEGAHDDLDYSEPPEPPLSDADAQWATELIARR